MSMTQLLESEERMRTLANEESRWIADRASEILEDRDEVGLLLARDAQLASRVLDLLLVLGDPFAVGSTFDARYEVYLALITAAREQARAEWRARTVEVRRHG